MRIRKSHLLSSFSPVPLSDPHHLINPSPPSDQLLPPIVPSDDSSSAADTAAGCHPLKQFGSEDDVRGRAVEAQGHKGSDTRKGSISGSQTFADHVLSPSTPSDDDDQDGRWCEGEKAIPFKKRRESFERIIKVEEEVTQNNGNNNKRDRAKMKTKTKTNKKCSSQNQDDEEEEEKVEEGGVEREREKKGKRGRGRGSAVVMEGSRCSRVNGRGWRCCQQTLVGYSLCEHHLGKGRLRSISSVKTRSLPGPGATFSDDHKPQHHHLLSQVSTNSSSSDDVVKQSPQDHQQEEEEENNKKPEITMGKKRMRLGVVKARSMSSLLGQTTTHVPLLDNTK